MLACLGSQPGDEVVSCAINFPGTHLAVLGAGLRLMLCEPDPLTLNLDPADLAARVTHRTVAVLVTHMNGLPADIGAITATAQRRAAELGITSPRIVVDAARALGAATPAGRVGGDGAWITMFSFHRKKLMTTLGEGGLLTTDCPATAQALRRLRSFGHDAVAISRTGSSAPSSPPNTTPQKKPTPAPQSGLLISGLLISGRTTPDIRGLAVRCGIG
jgi:perosamine synthetase